MRNVTCMYSHLHLHPCVPITPKSIPPHANVSAYSYPPSHTPESHHEHVHSHEHPNTHLYAYMHTLVCNIHRPHVHAIHIQEYIHKPHPHVHAYACSYTQPIAHAHHMNTSMLTHTHTPSHLVSQAPELRLLLSAQ